MFEKLTLAELKGAPLSILMFLRMNGNRAVTVTELSGKDATGFSDKPIKTGLLKLKELGMITETRRNRYQLTGKEFQLPLYWDEKTEPFGDSPRLSGDSPRISGVSPDLEKRVAALEAAVYRLPDRDKGQSHEGTVLEPELPLYESDREIYAGNFPQKYGVSPSDTASALLEIDGQWAEENEECGMRNEESEDDDLYSGNVPEKFGDSPKAGDSDSPLKELPFDADPEGVGDSPDSFGDIPSGLINNINLSEQKEVSKYETDTYLLTGNDKARGNLTAAENRNGVSPKALVWWDAALMQLQGSMDRTSFSHYLRDSVVSGYDDAVYSVTVKDSSIRDWCRCRVQDQLEKILSVMAGKDQSVDFICGADPVTVPESHMQFHQSIHRLHESRTEDQPEDEGLLPKSGYPDEDVLVEICNAYLQGEDPKFTADQLGEIIGLHPDPAVLRVMLHWWTDHEKAVKFCQFGAKQQMRQAKKCLLMSYGIKGPAVQELGNNDAVTLEIIDTECQQVIYEKGPEETGLMVYRIRECTKVSEDFYETK